MFGEENIKIGSDEKNNMYVKEEVVYTHYFFVVIIRRLVMDNDLQIEDLRIPIEYQPQKRKTLSITIKPNGHLQIKAPEGMSEQEIERFLRQKQFWIYKQAKRVAEKQKNRREYSEQEKRVLKEKARGILTERTEYYKQILNVDYTKIRIAEQKTRWGSCSGRGVISYNWRLILMPDMILDYVVVHELCHLIEMNHSKAFWNLVGTVLPDYQKRRAWLKENGMLYS